MVDYLGQLERSGYGGTRALKELGGAVVVGYRFFPAIRAACLTGLLFVFRQHFKLHFLTVHITSAYMVSSFQ